MSSILKGLPLKEGIDFAALQAEGKKKIDAINANPELYSKKYDIPLDHKHFVGAVLVAMDREEQRARQVKRDTESKIRSDLARSQQLAKDSQNIDQLKNELALLQKDFDPSYEYSDDYTFWNKQKDISSKINALKKRISDVEGQQVNELSNDTLASYKKKAGADATAADKQGDYKRGDKRMSGIIKATKKEFSNDSKNVNEAYITEGKILIEARITRKLWESAGQKIAEAQLTVDQINQIFQSAEKIQSAGGGNRTMLGKGKDAASAVNKAWEDLKTKVQNSGPIKGVDAMYDKAAEQLKQATGGDQGVMQYVQKYRDFAKKHPVAQSLIYSALIAAAGISGAGVGGAAALGLFKLVDKLLQGEKFSSAAYSGAKTGAMAYGASKVGDMIKGAQQHAAVSGEKVLPVAGKPGFDSEWDNYLTANPNSTMSPDQIKAAADSVAPVAKQAGKAVTSTVTDFAGNASGITIDQIMATPEFKQTLAREMARAGQNPHMIQAAKQLALSAGKTAVAKAAQANESIDLTESQLYLIIGKIVERQRKLDEGIMDTIKGAAGKAVGSAVDWAKTKGTNLTTKVTADKLLQAWKKAGSPMDSLDVAKIVQDAGVPSDTIKQVYGNMKIPFAGQPGANSATRNIDVDPSSVAPAAGAPSASAQPGAAATAPAQGAQQVQTAYAQVKKLIDQLDKKGKQRVVSALKKSLGLAVAEGSMGTAVSQPPGSTVSAGQRFYKPRHVPNQDELQKQGVEEESKGLWANIHAKQERIKHGSGERMRKPGSKGAPTQDALKRSAVKESKSSMLAGIQQVDEGWKEKLGAAALAGSMALGAAGAHARVTGDEDPNINRLTGKPNVVQTSTDTAPAKADTSSGYSKEYLQKAANPDRVGRYMISVEKAQELLKNMP